MFIYQRVNKTYSLNRFRRNNPSTQRIRFRLRGRCEGRRCEGCMAVCHKHPARKSMDFMMISQTILWDLYGIEWDLYGFMWYLCGIYGIYIGFIYIYGFIVLLGNAI